MKKVKKKTKKLLIYKTHCNQFQTQRKKITVRFTKLLTNGFRSSFQIPEVHHELGSFITQLSIKSRT